MSSNVKLGVGDVIPIDGKTLRRSHNKANEQDVVKIVSALAASQRLTLGQVKVADDANEIAALPQVLDIAQH